MSISQTLHAVADYLLESVKLAQNRRVGWLSVVRQTGVLEREQQPLLKKLKLLLLFNPLTEWIDTTHFMRLYIHDRSIARGREMATAKSRKQIRQFVDSYGINMDDFEPSDLESYETFEQFFVRKHTAASRPICEKNNHTHAVVVADSRVVVFHSIHETQTLWIKGQDFTITNLVMDVDLGERFKDACVASFRLSPQDYHRFHSPVTGRIISYRQIPGDYYQVDPLALSSDVDVLTRNHRACVVIDTEAFGVMLFVAIGATDVGSVQIHDKWRQPGNLIEKGDEIGLFQFGGSSIIVAFEKGRITFDQDLLEYSRQRIQTSVEVGMSLGRI